MKRNKKNNQLNIINYFNYIIIIINVLFNQLLIINCKECETIDVRNNPSTLQQLRNCTVIKGYLQIVLIQANDKYTYSDKDYVNYKFPELREVTEFVIFFDVAGLTSLGKLFPNLMVIRGKKLFLNYALAIDSMPDLKQLDLASLVSIQRGSVYINRNPNLCYLESINWDQLTENKVGMNFYKSMQPSHCLSLIGCNYYWSSLYCQKFRNDNVVSSEIKMENCNPQCLGGCWNRSDTGCAVCKGITDDGRCVEKCPDDKYLAADHLRCYTKTRCMELGRHILNNTCVRECPPGYIDYKNEQHQSDFICHPCTKCAKTCHVIDEIQYLSDAEIYKGCTTIRGNLSIRILSKIDIKHLEDALGDITEIQDFLKVYRTTSITSLNFLRSLKFIHGETLESDNYALSVYENRNLKNLWNWKEHENLIINNGGIFLHSNYKLCSYEIIQLKEHIKHDNSTDSIQENDEEILCEPFKLNVTITAKTHECITLEWLKDKNTDKTQILYKKIKNENVTIDDDYDDNICSRETWIKQILLHDDLKLSNDNINWIYNLTELKQNTWYALRIKTYGELFNSTYQSDFIRFKTEPDIPLSPQVYTLSKTSNSITLTWKLFTNDYNDNYYNDDNLNYKNQLITHYLIDIFYQPDNQDILDTRNYCTDPLKQTSSSNLNGKIDDQYDQINNTNKNNNNNDNDNINEQDDYDNCCNRIEDELEDREFISLIDEKFRCSRNSNIGNSCKIGIYHTQLRRRRHHIYLNGNEELIPDAYKSKYLIKSQAITEPFRSSYKIENLNYYTLYIFQFFACNYIGCSSYGLHSDRTAPLLNADNLYLTIEKGKKYNEYLLYFPQPKSPNGLTVAYNIEYRSESNYNGINGNDDNNDNDTPFTGSIQCITRLEHERNNYRYSIKINNRNFSARVRSISLAGPGLPTDWIFYKIEQQNNNEINYNEDKQINEINKDNNNNGEGMDPFVIFCLISLCCILAALCWIAYKKIILSRTITASESNIDEQILMQDFDTNNLDDSIEDSDL